MVALDPLCLHHGSRLVSYDREGLRGEVDGGVEQGKWRGFAGGLEGGGGGWLGLGRCGEGEEAG